jgi:type IV secretion system protein VirD4
MGTGGLAIHQARFARRHELRTLLSKVAIPDGVLLGVRRDFLFFNRFVVVRPTANRREIGNTLVVGPTRSGKGLLAVSQLLSWKHSVIVNDIKGELFAQTAGYRASLGDVYVLDPTGVGHCFDPLLGKHTEDELYSLASHLLFEADERERIFTQRATDMLTQMFLASRVEGIAPFLYTRSLIRQGLSAAAARLNQTDPLLAAQFLDVSFADANLSDRFLMSSWGTLKARMKPLLTETVVRCLTGSSFTAEMLLRSARPVTIYFRWPEQALLALFPLVRLLWGSLINELITVYDTSQGNGCKPVLLLIDEAGRTAIPSLADHATTVVGRGIYLWVAVQSLSQLAAVYGRTRAQVLKDNMETQVYYRPADLATAEHLERCLGRQSAFAHSATIREGEETSQGLSEQGIPLLTAQEIRQMKDEDIIGFHRHLPPFTLKRVDWRHHTTLQQRRSIKAPQLPPLPQIADIPEHPGGDRTSQPNALYIDPDMPQPNGEKTIIDLFRREQKEDLALH